MNFKIKKKKTQQNIDSFLIRYTKGLFFFLLFIGQIINIYAINKTIMLMVLCVAMSAKLCQQKLASS